MTDVQILRGAEMKVGDTHPNLRVKCLDDGNPFNLDGYTATIKIQRTDADSPKVDTQASVEAAGRGIVEYDWNAGDTDTSGVYLVEVVADDGSGSTVTFPNDGFAQIQVLDGL